LWQVRAAAAQRWNLVFAGMVREYYHATLLPPPLSVLEHGLNHLMRTKTRRPTTRVSQNG
jgi:hypothetical protein